MGEQQIVGFRFGDDAASDGDHDLPVALDDALETPALDAAVTGLTVEREHFAQADAGVALDLAIELDERPAQIFRQRVAEGRLTCAAQSYQRQTSLACGRLRSDVAHQPEHDVFELALRQLVEKAPDQSLLDRTFL